MEYELIAWRARAQVLTDVANLFLYIRDLANTPLQNLLLGVERLERGDGLMPDAVARMHRSVEKGIALHKELLRRFN